MEEAAQLFGTIVKRMESRSEEIASGPMMSHPGIRLKNKVFAFYYDNRMVFRLGKDFDPSAFGLKHWEPLSPFKKKPPLPGWFVVPFSEHNSWPMLTDLALERMQSGK